ncbi:MULTISPECIES: AAA family ATPase [Dictyoglomus]|jgi:MoxR-like ATPase|uniref:ATPase associated with various cellular activities AAA_3 n=1 Tax=Dictyoglomus turgidum (strain DSM 6724 / Z-1310) TaxID=515635 RepID=B8DZQ6_DICTD|nr:MULTISPECIES: MoxR family ATPase [Dictyoglomus]ACK41989.1 ATPase associated with various cellular activities AAA_3 [Dictyoglomus turgidum DSM 6724]PNV80537.1 MAG: MoxR family ATPase [Dictyoglomus turgidum]HBU31451.1 MoxR family ATPase [Dictyoglomus sp.]
MDVDRYVEFKEKVVKNVSKAIVGKEKIIELIAISFICGGHVLLEDVPGLGKTLMVKAFAKTIGGSFKRIQFTPDLLPSDLTGINFYNQKKGEFEFRPGPLFANVILADEINRATPRTQSSLLEAMEEKQVTVDGVTWKLPDPFMVLATQNPVETYGTFPLPEAELDRFFMRIKIGYPTREEEIEIINRNKKRDMLEDVESVVNFDEIEYLRNNFSNVKISREVLNYLLDIVEYTRNSDTILLGVSPRGSIALFKASQVYALFNGRDYVIPEDIKYLAPFILNHRIISMGASRTKDIYENINIIVDNVKVPLEEF